MAAISGVRFPVQVGRFEIRLENGTEIVSGPQEYMQEQGSDYLDRLLKGGNAAFNMSSHLSPNLYVAILVFLQNDFAGWLGERQMFGPRKAT